MTFDEFVRRKTQAAERAVLPAYITESAAPPPALEHLGNEWSRRLFDGDFFMSPARRPGLPACNLVFVRSRDGNTGARNPSDLGGGETDQHLIYEGLSRVAADVVLAGADTVRGSQVVFSVWHPELVTLRATLRKPRHPMQAVATRRGLDLRRELLFNEPSLQVVILTGAAGASAMQADLSARPWITTIVSEDPAGDLTCAFGELRELGAQRLSCIGGRTLAAQLMDAGLVEDLYLTTSARDGGEPNTPLPASALDGRAIVRKRGTGAEAGVVFEHLVLR